VQTLVAPAAAPQACWLRSDRVPAGSRPRSEPGANTRGGSRPDLSELRKACPEAEFLGRAATRSLPSRGAHRAVCGRARWWCRAWGSSGIVAVQAQTTGRPVIAAGAGGALETVLDGRTGRLVELDLIELDPRLAVADAGALLGCVPAATVGSGGSDRAGHRHLQQIRRARVRPRRSRCGPTDTPWPGGLQPARVYPNASTGRPQKRFGRAAHPWAARPALLGCSLEPARAVQRSRGPVWLGSRSAFLAADFLRA
jgi:hypothetical protein